MQFVHILSQQLSCHIIGISYYAMDFSIYLGCHFFTVVPIARDVAAEEYLFLVAPPTVGYGPRSLMPYSVTILRAVC